MIVWAISKELLDQRCVAPENIALTNHTLVRQFAGVDRELFGQKCKTQHALALPLASAASAVNLPCSRARTVSSCTISGEDGMPKPKFLFQLDASY